ncbi:hypothetical protein K439DRAFT_1355017 [Ramaria rubella]|nr:hypothetical protein K439DRAFT_1355017 [Ramaria rubella]
MTPKDTNSKLTPHSPPLTKATRENSPPPFNKPVELPPNKNPVQWGNVVLTSIKFTALYGIDIFRLALDWLRKPLALILVVYILATITSLLYETVSMTLYSSIIPPLCHLPGVSHLAPRLCPSPPSQPQNEAVSITGSGLHITRQADYPRLVNIQSATFEQLLDDSVGGAGLALEIKKAEMATSDLTALVRLSCFPNKDKMAETLDTFVEDARRTARGLQRFSAKVGGAVDEIIAVNDYALRQIEIAVSANSSPGFWQNTIVPFFSRRDSLDVLTTSFTEAMIVLEAELHTLIMAAEASLHDLDSLEELLRVLYTIVAREDASLSTSKQELLSNLWTILGGNRAAIRSYDSHLKLLGGLAEYRRQALAHVVGALQTLQAMSAELENLRDRVSRPVLSGDIIPLEVHVRSIRGGLNSLTEGRLKAKKIEGARYAKLVSPRGT